MSIVTIASSKGGAGKTTLAAILSGSISRQGHRVAVIDADYNHSLADWVQTFAHYPIATHTELDETKIIPLADRLAAEHDLVVIDTAGAAMQATVFAIGCADLVLIPCQLSSADVVEAERETLTTLTRNEGKPEAALDKIVAGRLNGFYKEVALLDQPYAKDDKQSVSQYLGSASVAGFAQVEIG